MKKILVLLIATTLVAVNSFATDSFAERDALTKKVQTNSRPIEIGYYPGSSAKDELYYYALKYLPLANYLTEKTGSLVSLVPEPNVAVQKNLIKSQRYKWMYINPEAAVLAEEIAYTPVVKQSSDIESVLIVPADSKVNKYADMEGKKIGIIKDTITSTLALYKLGQSVKNYKTFDAGTTGQASLFLALDRKNVDAIAVRKDIAEPIVKKNPTKYRITDSAGMAPGFILLAHTSVPQEEVDRVRSAFLSLKAEDAATAKMMDATGDKKAAGAYYSDWTDDFLNYARKAVAFLEPDYGRYVFDAAKNTYVEAYKLYADDIKTNSNKK